MPDLTVSIPRSRWLRGAGDPGYLASDGRFTCLGAILRAAGVPPSVLEMARGCRDIPRDYILRVPVRLIAMRDGVAPAWVLQKANIEPGISDELRERTLTEIARSIGIQLEFTK